MLYRFKKINDLLYRSSSPAISDLLPLKQLGIRKIVSLDEDAGKKIDRSTKLLGLKHIMMPIEIGKRGSLLKFLCQDLFDLLQEDGPVLVHCKMGKDRTGMAIGMFRCRYQNWPCKKAISEAKKLGFGIGLDDKIIKLYEKLIENSCKHDDHKKKNDINEAYDIVSNQREYPSDYADYSPDIFSQMSWAPYGDYRVREFPYANVDIDWPEQYENRITVGLDDGDVEDMDYSSIPQSGTFDTSSMGLLGAGPSLMYSGTVL